MVVRFGVLATLGIHADAAIDEQGDPEVVVGAIHHGSAEGENEQNECSRTQTEGDDPPDRRLPRQAAAEGIREYFSAERMVEDTLGVYERVL